MHDGTTEPVANEVGDPLHDAEREFDIGELDLYSTQARERLDAAARTAAERLGLPVGVVSIVLEGTHFNAGAHGLTGELAEERSMPVEWSLCATVVRRSDAYVVEDAGVDPAHRDNPLVDEGSVRSYAGVPLVSRRGHVLGAYCVMDSAPRHFTPDQVEQLRALAADVVAELERCRITGAA